MAKSKGLPAFGGAVGDQGSYTRRRVFSGTRLYMSYAECLKKYYNAVDGTFYEIIKVCLSHRI